MGTFNPYDYKKFCSIEPAPRRWLAPRHPVPENNPHIVTWHDNREPPQTFPTKAGAVKYAAVEIFWQLKAQGVAPPPCIP